MVTANRSWATRLLRRARASSDVCCSMPMPAINTMTPTSGATRSIGVLPPAPHRQAADDVGGSGDVPGERSALPRDDGQGRSTWRPTAAGELRARPAPCRPTAAAVAMPNSAPLAAHAIGVPGRRRPASWPTIAAGRGGEERGAANPLGDRSQQGAHPIDRREHDVGDVGAFERQRAALCAAAQRGEEGQRGDHPDQRRAVLGNVGDGLRPTTPASLMELLIHSTRAAAEQRDEIHAVGGVEPFDVAETVALAAAAQIVQDVERRSHSPVAASRFGSADQPDQLATYSRGGVEPGVLHGQHVQARTDAGAAVGDDVVVVRRRRASRSGRADRRPIEASCRSRAPPTTGRCGRRGCVRDACRSGRRRPVKRSCERASRTAPPAAMTVGHRRHWPDVRPASPWP